MSPILYIPFNSDDETETTEGLIASTTNVLFADREPETPGSARVNVASFPAISRINPLLSESDDVFTYPKSVFRCPSPAIYWKVKIDVPVPLV